MVDIKDEALSLKIARYFCGDMNALDGHFDTIPARPAMEEREEIIFIQRALALSEKSRMEGLLALESELNEKAIAACDVFEYGLPFVIDGEEASFIDEILGNIIARENDPVKRNLSMAKKTALLSIQCGDSRRRTLLKILSFFGDDIRNFTKNTMRLDQEL
jgi:hypothetical protein